LPRSIKRAERLRSGNIIPKGRSIPQPKSSRRIPP